MSNQGDQFSRISLRTPAFDDAPQSVKVYEDSIVRFSKRVNFDVGCQMNFSNYPVDNQTCEVKIESFSYQTHEVFLKWGGNSTLNKEIALPGYLHYIHMVLEQHQQIHYVY